MKAVVLDEFGSSENFRLDEVADPLIQPGNVLVKIKASSFNPIDYQMRQGLGESKLLHSPILGREMSGIVIDVGTTSSFKVGDEVFGYVGSLGSNGTYAEYISLPAQLISHKPSNISFDVAAAIPMVSLTALQCVDRLNPDKDASIFVAGGAGGVGSFVIKLLIAKGINNIITTAGNDRSRESLAMHGLEDWRIIDYRKADVFNEAYKANSNTFFDYCIDIVGGELSDVCSRLIKINGSYADITFLGSPSSRELLFDKGAVVYNISNYAYSLNKDVNDIAYYGQKLGVIRNLVDSGALLCPDVYNTGNLSVAAVQKAHHMMEANCARGRKLVMSIA